MTEPHQPSPNVPCEIDFQLRREKTELGKAQRNASRPRRRLRCMVSRTTITAMLATFLPAAMNGQESQSKDPLAIDGSGNVRINGNLGINTPALTGQSLHIIGSSDSMPLNITNPDNSINWLTVLSKGQVLMNGGNVGIGTKNPAYPLQVGDSLVNSDGKISIGKKTSETESRFMVLGYNSNYDFGFSDWGNKMQLGVNWDAPANSLYINSKGSLGIGTGDPKAKLDVNGEALFRGELTEAPKEPGLVGSSSALYFTNKEHLHSAFGNTKGFAALENSQNYQALMILGRWTGLNTRVVRLYDRVGIGGTACPQDDKTKDYEQKEVCTPQDALDVNGNVRVRNNLYVYDNVFYYDHLEKKQWLQLWGRNDRWIGWKEATAPSDSRLKSELQPIPSALDKLDRLRGVTYRWNDNGLRYLTRDIETTISAGPQATAEENQKLWQSEREKQYKELVGTQVGVVAQDVEAVLPEAVTTDDTGYKSVRYNELIPLLIEAVKQLEGKVKDQSQLIRQQQQQIAEISASHLTAEQEQQELATIKAQLAGLQAAVQRRTTTQLVDAPDIVHLSGSSTR